MNVDHRKGKMRLDADGQSAAYQYDYKEPQGVWETVNALMLYNTSLRSIRPEGYSGHNMLLMLHQKLYFAGFVI